MRASWFVGWMGLGLPARAWALSCAFGPTAMSPDWDTEEVPTNVVVRLQETGGSSGEARTWRLVEEGTDREVEVVVAQDAFASHEVWSVTPASPLAPDTAYTLYDLTEADLSDGFDPELDGWGVTSFRTTEGQDTEAPEAPEIVRVRKVRSTSMWGASAEVRVLLLPTEDTVHYRLTLEEPDGSSKVVWAVGWARDDGLIEVSVGEGVCGGVYPVNTQPIRVSVEAVDLAGNVSARSEAPRATGCSTSSGSATGLLALLGLPWMRRRRTGPGRIQWHRRGHAHRTPARATPGCARG